MTEKELEEYELFKKNNQKYLQKNQEQEAERKWRAENPFSKDFWNVTRQMLLAKENSGLFAELREGYLRGKKEC